MSAHDWMVVAIILGAALAITGALLTVTLLGAASTIGDLRARLAAELPVPYRPADEEYPDYLRWQR